MALMSIGLVPYIAHSLELTTNIIYMSIQSQVEINVLNKLTIVLLIQQSDKDDSIFLQPCQQTHTSWNQVYSFF